MEGGDLLAYEALLARRNPLLRGISRLKGRIFGYKEKAKEYYFRVVLSQYACPKCVRGLTMTGQSECSCSCGHSLDPTIAFQKSPCCNARLIKRTFHYACRSCRHVVSSRFLFDEKVFDKVYFKEMMKASRQRAKKKREEVRRLLAMSRASPLSFMEEPNLESIPGLLQDLNAFVKVRVEAHDFSQQLNSRFSMAKYREHILSFLGSGSRLFTDFPALNEDFRKDKIWRFVTLIFMQQDGDVVLTQYGHNLLVETVNHETYD